MKNIFNKNLSRRLKYLISELKAQKRARIINLHITSEWVEKNGGSEIEEKKNHDKNTYGCL